MSEKFNVIESFGSQVFNDAVMRERLPKHIYQSLKKTMNEGTELEKSIADVVASAMKDWAVEKGATHYTHWFQPMTGITAEKHDSFIAPSGDGKALMDFSGNKWVFLIIANLLIFVMGMFLDGSALLLILTPLLYPIAAAYEIDLIVFGMIMLVNLYCGCLTPPFGTLMYITCNLTDVSVPQFVKYAWGFIVAMLSVMLLMAVFPGIVTFLPNLIYG